MFIGRLQKLIILLESTVVELVNRLRVPLCKLLVLIFSLQNNVMIIFLIIANFLIQKLHRVFLGLQPLLIDHPLFHFHAHVRNVCRFFELGRVENWGV